MNIRTTLLFTAIAAVLEMTTGCRQSLIEDLAARESDRESYIVQWEIRTPIDAPLLTGKRIKLLTNDSSSGHVIKETTHTDGENKIYRGKFLIFRETRRFILIDDNNGGVLVYVLHIRTVAKVADWTSWQMPDFSDTSGGTAWSLMNGKIDRLKKEIPKGSPVELRYRVEKNQFSVADALRATRK